MQFFLPDMREEVGLRIDRLRRLMRESHVDALLASTTANIFYLSGRVYRGYVYVPLEGEPLWLVVRPDAFDARSRVVALRKPEMIPDELGRFGIPMPECVALECQEASYSDIVRLQKVFAGSRFTDASALLDKAREIKTPFEIAAMKRDGLHHVAVYERIDRCFKRDMTDLEFQIEIERVLRREGCIGYPRVRGDNMEINLGSVVYGPNADVPGPYDFTMGGAGFDPSLPVGADGSIMHPGHTVMVDMNGGFNGYQTDMTRTWRIGDVPDIAYKAHACSIAILRELEKTGVPGTRIGCLYERAVAMAREAGLEKYFMGHRSQVKFIGHGVGIQLNELPVIMGRNESELKENMTLAIEPKFVIPEVGPVGIENTYMVRPDGLDNITVFREELTPLE